MTVTRKIRQSGNSASITLPRTVLQALEVETGDEVEFDIVGGAVVMRRSASSSTVDRARQVSEVAARELERLLGEAPEETEALSSSEEEAIRDCLKVQR
jgi:antitoxin component of MazEF toxin-antitoxin module